MASRGVWTPAGRALFLLMAVFAWSTGRSIGRAGHQLLTSTPHLLIALWSAGPVPSPRIQDYFLFYKLTCMVSLPEGFECRSTEIKHFTLSYEELIKYAKKLSGSLSAAKVGIHPSIMKLAYIGAYLIPLYIASSAFFSWEGHTQHLTGYMVADNINKDPPDQKYSPWLLILPSPYKFG